MESTVNMAEESPPKSERLPAAARGALRPGADADREKRVATIGALTGLRHENGRYRRANFERALLLDAIVAALRPADVLELGTGRGLGALAMAAAAHGHGFRTCITTIDVLPAGARQHWPIETGGQCEIRQTSRTEVWSEHFPAEWRGMISEVTGFTTGFLPRLLKEGKTYDFIFIDAGHDLFSVVHDLSYAAMLLAPGGWILMDDFAPASDYGLATCLASSHARRLFRVLEVLVTEGVVFGDEELPGLPRSMVLLGERSPGIGLHRGRLWFWKLAGKILDLSFRSSLFPLAAK